MIDDGHNPAAKPLVVVQPIDGGAVLMNIATGDCFELNRIGVEVWNGLANGHPMATIVAALASSYDRPLSAIEADVRALIADLTRHGLLVHNRA